MAFSIGLVLGLGLGVAVVLLALLPKILRDLDATKNLRDMGIKMFDDSVTKNKEAKKDLQKARRFYEESNRLYREIQARIGTKVDWDGVAKSIPDNMPLTDDDVFCALMDAAVPLEVLAGEPQSPHLSPAVNAEIRRVVLKIRAIVSQKASEAKK